MSQIRDLCSTLEQTVLIVLQQQEEFIEPNPALKEIKLLKLVRIFQGVAACQVFNSYNDGYEMQ
jgi:hypothetical protein